MQIIININIWWAILIAALGLVNIALDAVLIDMSIKEKKLFIKKSK